MGGAWFWIFARRLTLFAVTRVVGNQGRRIKKPHVMKESKRRGAERAEGKIAED